jgi:alpha-1,6-mannosyltransferase
MTFVTAVFRCDMILMAVPMLLALLVSRKVSFSQLVLVGVVSSIVSVALTVAVDSYFWNQSKMVWPELEVFYFNAILGKSTEWGTSPFHWYFTSALPRALLLFLLFMPFAFVRGFPRNLNSLRTMIDDQVVGVFFPVLFFLIAYSKLEHKELRFVFPAVTVLTGAAALGFTKVLAFIKKSSLGKVGTFILLLVFPFNFIVASNFLLISSFNYPGGVALQKLHEIAPIQEFKQTVHICDLAATSGVSRFVEDTSRFTYNKTDLPQDSETFQQYGFDFTISELKQFSGYELAGEVTSFGGLKFNPPQLILKQALFIHKKKQMQ